MKIGIQTVVFPGHVPVLEQAVKIEAKGFHSYWAGEHHHYPEATPVPEFYKETGVPGFYRSCPDPLIMLTAVATRAPRLSVGTGIMLLPLHDIVVFANQIATVADLIEGEAIIGLGIGWNELEFQNHGVEFASRIDKTFEQLKALKHIWSNTPCEFHGEFVDFGESTIPVPQRKPYPAMIMGGRLLRKNLQIIAEVGDGWLPTDTYEKTFGGDLEGDIEKLNTAVKAEGRDPASLTNVFLYAETMLYDRDPVQFAKDAPTRDDLERLESLGFKHVAIGLPTFSQEHFDGALEHAAKVAEPWL